MPRIALVTARAAEHHDTDLAPLVAAVTAADAEAAIACWDDDTVEWGDFDAAVLRSTWDYPHRIEQFLEWVERVDRLTTLINDATTIRWNLDKRYLLDLDTAGVPIVPTAFVGPGEDVVLPDAAEVVVKPVVSAGAKDTARFDRDDPAAFEHATTLLDEGRAVMIQPYLSTVDTDGEHALICFDGELSHAFRKGPLLRRGGPPSSALFAEEEISPVTPRPDEVAVARDAIVAVRERLGSVPAYARVDLIRDDEGLSRLLELELVEPSVYHFTDPLSAERFAAAVLRRTVEPGDTGPESGR